MGNSRENRPVVRYTPNIQESLLSARLQLLKEAKDDIEVRRTLQIYIAQGVRGLAALISGTMYHSIYCRPQDDHTTRVAKDTEALVSYLLEMNKSDRASTRYRAKHVASAIGRYTLEGWKGSYDGNGQDELVRHVRKTGIIGRNDSVLELGSGRGQWLRALQKHGQERVVGIEGSPSFVLGDHNASEEPFQRVGIVDEVQDFLPNELLLPVDEFDCSAAHFVLDRVHNPRQLILNLIIATRTGGRVLLSTPLPVKAVDDDPRLDPDLRLRYTPRSNLVTTQESPESDRDQIIELLRENNCSVDKKDRVTFTRKIKTSGGKQTYNYDLIVATKLRPLDEEKFLTTDTPILQQPEPNLVLIER